MQEHSDLEHIAHTIVVLRRRRVILDRDLASIYGVTTKRLNEQVKRNMRRFPDDFMFQVSDQEAEILRSQLATSKSTTHDARGGRRYLPFAFTERAALLKRSFVAVRLTVRPGSDWLRLLCFENDYVHRTGPIEVEMFPSWIGAHCSGAAQEELAECLRRLCIDLDRDFAQLQKSFVVRFAITIKFHCILSSLPELPEDDIPRWKS